MKNFMNLGWMTAVCVWAIGCVSCVSIPPTRAGLQSEFLAVNPARIAAFPPILMPHPVEKTSIDPAAIITSQIQSTIESKVLASFKNQPNVNGVSFQSVRNSLKSSPQLNSEIESEIRSLGQLTNSGSARETLLLSKECRGQKNLLDFYKFCMTHSTRWVPLLNQFSVAVQNADAMLLPIVTSFEKKTENSLYVVQIGLAILLIDTNSGKLIWGRDTIERAESPAGTKQFSDVLPLLDKIFAEAFWSEFPGRRSRTEQGKQQGK